MKRDRTDGGSAFGRWSVRLPLWCALVVFAHDHVKGQECPHREYWRTQTVADEYNQAITYSCVLRTDGVVYFGGSFGGIPDFDPGPGKDRKRSKSGERDDAFMTVYDDNLNYLRTWAFGSKQGFDQVSHMAILPDGNVVAVGDFGGKVNFAYSGPREVRRAKGSQDAFILLMGLDFGFRWVGVISGESEDVARGVACDSDGNIVVCGYFGSGCDFDPGTGKQERSSNGERDIYVLRLTPQGAFKWVDTFGAGQRRHSVGRRGGQRRQLDRDR